MVEQLVNWAELRKSTLINTRRIESCTPCYWDKCASGFNQNVPYMGDLTKNQLHRLKLKPADTVLDVGAGTGRITIPVAKRVKQVTALEPSKNMLDLLKENAEKENVTNITYLNRPLEALSVDSVGVHDVVIASFSLFMVDIEKELAKMDTLAKKRVYLFLSASQWMDQELQNIVYGDSIPASPDYIYIYNILHDLGILANVEIWNYNAVRSYNDLADAVTKFTETYRIPPEKEGELREHLRRILVKDQGKLWLNRKRKTATIWWTKHK
ncbi:MAG: class I SAM-dependent methyltransferase [Candidatus Bathyarchaeota archaeon]|nr:class I SAM-dependent methyltransferase [Candidatus Bathyarchaeota archaeon]